MINVNIQTRDSRAVWTVDRMEAGVDLRDEEISTWIVLDIGDKQA